MILFSVATLGLVFMLFGAMTLGGFYAYGALAYVTVFTFSIDRLISRDINNANTAQEDGVEFPASLKLSAALGLLHFVLLMLAIWAVAGASGLGIAEKGAIFIAAGLFFGQVSHPNAHELIHRKQRKFNRIGRMVYSSLLVGHHTSAHRLVHHSMVCTDKDPVSAPLGLGFYRFAQKAVIGTFRDGLKAENKRLRLKDGYWWQHPYFEYFSVAIASLTLAFIIAGMGGFMVLVGLAIYAQIQMLLSDYVQHYGLAREILADGRPEPVGPQHSWNSPHVFSSALMLNAPRHSDHHMNPTRAYPALQLDAQTMPMLPHSLPVMALIALWPDKWRFIMDPLSKDWQIGWKPQSSLDLGKLAPQRAPLAEASGVARVAMQQSHNENPDKADPDVVAVRDLIARANAHDGRTI